ncbi:hypothetical protein EVAR_46623_1, partial [Eumeta japonica]
IQAPTASESSAAGGGNGHAGAGGAAISFRLGVSNRRARTGGRTQRRCHGPPTQ